MVSIVGASGGCRGAPDFGDILAGGSVTKAGKSIHELRENNGNELIIKR